VVRIFIYTKEFDILWKLTGLDDSDLLELESDLLSNPAKGNVIQGTIGLRKLRWKVPGKGKRGGIRLLYVDFAKHSKLILVSLIKKNETENISAKDKKILNKFIKELEANL